MRRFRALTSEEHSEDEPHDQGQRQTDEAKEAAITAAYNDTLKATRVAGTVDDACPPDETPSIRAFQDVLAMIDAADLPETDTIKKIRFACHKNVVKLAAPTLLRKTRPPDGASTPSTAVDASSADSRKRTRKLVRDHALRALDIDHSDALLWRNLALARLDDSVVDATFALKQALVACPHSGASQHSLNNLAASLYRAPSPLARQAGRDETQPEAVVKVPVPELTWKSATEALCEALKRHAGCRVHLVSNNTRPVATEAVDSVSDAGENDLPTNVDKDPAQKDVPKAAASAGNEPEVTQPLDTAPSVPTKRPHDGYDEGDASRDSKQDGVPGRTKRQKKAEPSESSQSPQASRSLRRSRRHASMAETQDSEQADEEDASEQASVLSWLKDKALATWKTAGIWESAASQERVAEWYRNHTCSSNAASWTGGSVSRENSNPQGRAEGGGYRQPECASDVERAQVALLLTRLNGFNGEPTQLVAETLFCLFGEPVSPALESWPSDKDESQAVRINCLRLIDGLFRADVMAQSGSAQHYWHLCAELRADSNISSIFLAPWLLCASLELFAGAHAHATSNGDEDGLEPSLSHLHPHLRQYVFDGASTLAADVLEQTSHDMDTNSLTVYARTVWALASVAYSEVTDTTPVGPQQRKDSLERVENYLQCCLRLIEGSSVLVTPHSVSRTLSRADVQAFRQRVITNLRLEQAEKAIQKECFSEAAELLQLCLHGASDNAEVHLKLCQSLAASNNADQWASACETFLNMALGQYLATTRKDNLQERIDVLHDALEVSRDCWFHIARLDPMPLPFHEHASHATLATALALDVLCEKGANRMARVAQKARPAAVAAACALFWASAALDKCHLHKHYAGEDKPPMFSKEALVLPELRLGADQTASAESQTADASRRREWSLCWVLLQSQVHNRLAMIDLCRDQGGAFLKLLRGSLFDCRLLLPNGVAEPVHTDDEDASEASTEDEYDVLLQRFHPTWRQIRLMQAQTLLCLHGPPGLPKAVSKSLLALTTAGRRTNRLDIREHKGQRPLSLTSEYVLDNLAFITAGTVILYEQDGRIREVSVPDAIEAKATQGIFDAELCWYLQPHPTCMALFTWAMTGQAKVDDVVTQLSSLRANVLYLAADSAIKDGKLLETNAYEREMLHRLWKDQAEFDSTTYIRDIVTASWREHWDRDGFLDASQTATFAAAFSPQSPFTYLLLARTFSRAGFLMMEADRPRTARSHLIRARRACDVALALIGSGSDDTVAKSPSLRAGTPTTYIDQLKLHNVTVDSSETFDEARLLSAQILYICSIRHARLVGASTSADVDDNSDDANNEGDQQAALDLSETKQLQDAPYPFVATDEEDLHALEFLSQDRTEMLSNARDLLSSDGNWRHVYLRALIRTELGEITPALEDFGLAVRLSCSLERLKESKKETIAIEVINATLCCLLRALQQGTVGSDAAYACFQELTEPSLAGILPSNAQSMVASVLEGDSDIIKSVFRLLVLQVGRRKHYNQSVVSQLAAFSLEEARRAASSLMEQGSRTPCPLDNDDWRFCVERMTSGACFQSFEIGPVSTALELTHHVLGSRKYRLLHLDDGAFMFDVLDLPGDFMHTNADLTALYAEALTLSIETALVKEMAGWRTGQKLSELAQQDTIKLLDSQVKLFDQVLDIWRAFSSDKVHTRVYAKVDFDLLAKEVSRRCQDTLLAFLGLAGYLKHASDHQAQVAVTTLGDRPHPKAAADDNKPASGEASGNEADRMTSSPVLFEEPQESEGITLVSPDLAMSRSISASSGGLSQENSVNDGLLPSASPDPSARLSQLLKPLSKHCQHVLHIARAQLRLMIDHEKIARAARALGMEGIEPHSLGSRFKKPKGKRSSRNASQKAGKSQSDMSSQGEAEEGSPLIPMDDKCDPQEQDPNGRLATTRREGGDEEAAASATNLSGFKRPATPSTHQ